MGHLPTGGPPKINPGSIYVLTEVAIAHVTPPFVWPAANYPISRTLNTVKSVADSCSRVLAVLEDRSCKIRHGRTSRTLQLLRLV